MVRPSEVVARLRDDPRALPRLATLVENEDPLALEILDALYPLTGNAHVVGVTGPPGVGKSSLISSLIALYRESQRPVAVLAIDPTSPLGGGAVLGDRIRMMDWHADSGVYVRSMSSRGRQGGLAWNTAELVHLLDAAGFPVILVETVGVGQDGTDVAHLADTVVVVEAPGLGDSVQAIKSGLLEIGDIVVVNKADQPGANDALRTLRSTLSLGTPRTSGVVVLGISATTGEGVPELLAAIDNHIAQLNRTGERDARRARGSRAEVLTGVRASLDRQLTADVCRTDQLSRLVAQVANRETPPRRAVEEITSVLTRSSS